MGTRSGSGGGIFGWEKQGGASEEEDYVQEEDQEDCDVGLGLRMQPNNNNENNNDTTSSSSSSSSVFPNRKSMEVSYHPYFTGDYACAGSSAAFAGYQLPYMGLPGGSNSSSSSSTLQSPDCFPSNLKPPPKSLQHHPLSFSGKMAASGNVRVPFTAAQWQELERQTMILKHMMSSASPVPQELQLPIPTKSFSNVAVPPSHPNRSGDPEPWRCRRTDGKKWRCSRDVAPHQKYCERHSHKNRPRSRKPVELPAAASTTTADYLLDPTKTTAPAATTRRSLASQTQQPPVDSRQALSSHFGTPYDQDPSSGFPSTFASPQPFDHPRCLDWFMKGETVPTSNSIQEWHHQHQNDLSAGSKGDATVSRENNTSSGGSRSNIDPFQLNQSSHYSTPQHSSLFLMEGSMDPGRGQQTRRFIDAWSNVDEGSGSRAMSGYSSSSGKNNLTTSSLTLTMCGGEGDDYSNRMGEKPHWMNAGMVHQGSWMGSPPGGPLAEALCLGSIGGSARYQTSPRGCSSVTTVSTTSGGSSSKDEGQEEFNFIG